MNTKTWILFTAMLPLVMACGNRDEPKKVVTNDVTHSVNVDNTGINVRDRDSKTMTPGDQSNEKNDLRITQDIRKALVDDSNLSTNAKNIKVITVNGVVTLRGPVDSPAEKDVIQKKVEAVGGIAKVDNQLEVKGQ